MAWISQGTDNETGLPLWFNTDTGEMKYGKSGSQLNPDAYDENGTMIATGWNPNMAFPAEQGGYSVRQLSSSYLANGGDPNDQAAFERFMRASYPLYNGPLNPDAIVPPSAMPESAPEGLAHLALLAPAIGGILSSAGVFGGAPTFSGSFNPSLPFQSAGADGVVGNGWGVDPTFSGTFNPALPQQTTFSGSFNPSIGGYVPPGGTVSALDVNAGMDAADAAAGIGGTAPTPTMSIPGYGDIYGSMPSILKNLPGLGSLFNSGSGLWSGNSGTGIFGSLFGNNGLTSILDKGAASLPVLAAIDYARNQSPLDTSRLEGLYSQFNPNALASQYDQNTLLGRGALTDSLTNRGVMGSSFGDQSLTNFNTTRDLGRSTLLNQGIGQQADIAKNIADMNFKSRQLKNQLYGSSLLALGNVFGGRSSPTINFGGV